MLLNAFSLRSVACIHTESVSSENIVRIKLSLDSSQLLILLTGKSGQSYQIICILNII